MKILLTGSSGLVGTALVSALAADGHEIIRLTRAPSGATGTIVLWDPSAAEILNHDKLEGLDAAIHLAGENIGTSRWTPSKKAAIRNSRVQGTGLLARTLITLKQPPAVFITASATGYYGDRGEEVLREDSAQGEGFLPGVCRDWEEAARMAEGKGIRVVRLRIGFVLSPDGGGLSKMLPPFKLGIAGRVGSGRQWMSWIAIDDVVGVIQHVMEHPELEGPVNAVSPNPVRNAEFTRILGRTLGRPTVIPLPTFVARLVIGELADELLLASGRVMPTKLKESGYVFRRPDLEPALRDALKNA